MFQLKPIEELPEKREREFVDYDSILDSFLIRRDQILRGKDRQEESQLPEEVVR